MSFNFDFVKEGPILFIGCHPDDVEIGCGGVIHKLKNKVPIYVITLSKNSKNPNNKNLVKEHLESLKTLGVKKQNIILGDFITREFSYSRQEILDFLVSEGKKINPTCIFTHSADLHQDHKYVKYFLRILVHHLLKLHNYYHINKIQQKMDWRHSL